MDGFRLGPSAPEHRAVVDGDEKSAAIAAASIVAKVTRDRMMRRIDALYPAYGFRSHVGYITPSHTAIVREVGPVARSTVAPWRAKAYMTDDELAELVSSTRRLGTIACAAIASSARTSGSAATSSTSSFAAAGGSRSSR